MHVTPDEIAEAYRDAGIEGGCCVVLALVAAALAIAGLVMAVIS